MNGGGRRRPALLAALFVAVLGVDGARAEPVVLAEQARGALAPAGEHRVRIEGLRGEVYLTSDAVGELKFSSAVLGRADQDLPVTLLSDGSSLFLRGTEGNATVARKLWLALPDELSVEVEVDSGKVIAAGLGGDVEIRGHEIQVAAQRLRGNLTLRLEKGDLELLGLADGLDVEASDARLNVREIEGTVVAELRDSDLVANGVGGDVEIHADGGSVRLGDLDAGGELRVSRTAVTLKGATAPVRIESDASVVLQGVASGVNVTGYGGSIRGTDLDGPVEIDVQGTEVVLESVRGSLGLQGNDARVQLRAIQNELHATVYGGTLEVKNSSGPVTVTSDGGDVTLADTAAAVTVDARGGSVSVTGASGAVNVEADVLRLEVGWSTLPREEDSVIRNDGGDVVVRFPRSGGCRIDARTRNGWIESELPEVKVTADRERAGGLLNRRSRPAVRIESEGNVSILPAQAGAAER